MKKQFRNRMAMLAGWLLLSAVANAATLKPETIAAWDDYLQAANAELQERISLGGRFLWTFENAERAARVRGGEIVIAPAPGQNPKKVPGGLIHHWMGAVFVPDLKLDDILDVTRDYDHYKEFYRPFVMASKTIARNGLHDRFSMLLMDKALFLKTALDAEYEATNVRLGDGRFYSVSKSTRVQQIEDYGQAGEHRMADGQGSGYIWKVYSIARFEQRDGGVYVELEAIVLSRDIPAMAHFVVDPIVRRVSRNSLFISLHQTEEAARSSFVAAGKPVEVPASVEQPSGVPASPSMQKSAFTGVH